MAPSELTRFPRALPGQLSVFQDSALAFYAGGGPARNKKGGHGKPRDTLDKVVKTPLSSQKGSQPKKQLVLASLAAVDHLFIMRRLCAHSGGTDIQGSGKITQGCLAKKLLNQVQQSGRLGEQKCSFHPLSHVPSLLL